MTCPNFAAVKPLLKKDYINLRTLFVDGSFWFQRRLIKEANFSLMSSETKQSSELISWNIVLMNREKNGQ